MKTNFSVLAAFVAAPALASLATPFRAPPDVAHVRLERIDSPAVIVDKIWLERKAGPLVVAGYVLKRHGLDDTSRSTLEAVLLDARGTVLRVVPGGFTPHQLQRHLNRPAYGSYRIEIGALPADTVRIVVRARDEARAGPAKPLTPG